MAKAYTVMAGLLANACSEEPDALIALVRVCGGAPRVTGGSTRKAQGHYGAMQEFVEARNDFAAGNFKGTILNACKAYESVMKSVLAKDSGAADDLIRGLEKAGILDDLPTKLRRPFQTKILQTVPFMRNELAGHGQGQEVLPVSRELAELCLHFAGSLILFCVRRHLALNPPEEPPASTGHVPQEDDLPF